MTNNVLIAWARRVALALETPLCLDACMGDDGTMPRDPHAVRERELHPCD